ncbi:HNH endonuclease [Bacillus sp. AFS040349]|uniref:HNH endonuclease n=1 Tax=Bacillus sp. AFS040349 TaxID=2033502 RepID=UPI00210039D9|nr:HNH endonuclease [Bacillus sp. AFS040349]
MKRDIQINYGILDQIIEQLHTYKNALNQMHSSLTSIAVYVESNAGKSLDVWDDTIQQSKKNINSYQAQIDDLLSLFENYVTDTTAYITPISRNSMMRVDRNDIWWNLTQIESGVNNNMFNAILETHKSPSFLFGLFDDPTPEEIERSRHNKQQLDAIRTNIESSKAMLEKNIEGLWDLYETKVKKFENVDDEYSNKASAVKDTYTNFFEGVSDVVSVTVEGVWNFIKGLGVAIYEIAEGLISLVIDAGIIAISSKIPDSIEPEFLKKAANTRVETFAGTLEQIIDDPIIVLESVAQSISDTSEKEGIMYVTGGAATSLVPYVGQSKYLKLLKVEKDKAPNTKAVNPAISQKVKEIVQNNKVFEGIKKETVELYKDVKNGGTQFVDDVTNFLGRTLFPNQTLQLSTANSVPVNVFSRSAVEDRIDSVVSRSSVKVEEKGNGNKLKVEDFTKEILETKPMNSPIPEKWYKKGGSISIEDNGTWTYTNKSGVSVRYPGGYPDFTPFIHPNVKPVKIEVHSPKNNPKDFENANQAAGLTKDTDPPIIDIRRPPDGYTWHHHEDGRTMMLVDEDIHREFRHIGGQSKVNGKNK